MEKVLLYGTPLSHFARKIRILLTELEVPFEMIRPGNLVAVAMEGYGQNPLMRIPTLVHGEETVFDSDHIARYVVGKYDPGDRFGVRSESVRDMNQLAVIGGIMDNEVVLILAKRGGLADIEGVAYFQKLQAAIDAGLAWLDREIDPDAPAFTYVDIATICMWQHAAHYRISRTLDAHRRIAARVARFAERPSVAQTTPEASLAAGVEVKLSS
jgi:glutathione S-transferase